MCNPLVSNPRSSVRGCRAYRKRSVFFFPERPKDSSKRDADQSESLQRDGEVQDVWIWMLACKLQYEDG